MSEGLFVAKSSCACCGLWTVTSDGEVSEFASESEAQDFATAERVRRLARIHGITDEARIQQGIADILETLNPHRSQA